jgi:hypothetical protein
LQTNYATSKIIGSAIGIRLTEKVNNHNNESKSFIVNNLHGSVQIVSFHPLLHKCPVTGLFTDANETGNALVIQATQFANLQ